MWQRPKVQEVLSESVRSGPAGGHRDIAPGRARPTFETADTDKANLILDRTRLSDVVIIESWEQRTSLIGFSDPTLPEWLGRSCPPASFGYSVGGAVPLSRNNPIET